MKFLVRTMKYIYMQIIVSSVNARITSEVAGVISVRRVSFKSRLSSTTARTFWRGRERERERERGRKRERERREGGREREIKEVAIKKKKKSFRSQNNK